jgi:hypothetical protein
MIVGPLFLTYSIRASHVTQGIFTVDVTRKQETFNRVFYFVLCLFISLWGVAHLVSFYWLTHDIH